MCDTVVALPSVTAYGNLLFAKNSDREPDEAQDITLLPRKSQEATTVRCTYIEVPQVEETYACILSRPFQMWGAEMGANEHGVVIGNEAVFTKVKIIKKNTGLTGMDMLRLALERAVSAKAALDCIISLLEQYGQDACGGYRNKNFFYHNSFIIADPGEAFVLETAGKHWAVEEVRDIRSISNRLSITKANRLSADAQNYARKKNWGNDKNEFQFQKAYSDWFYTRMGRASKRQYCTENSCRQKEGKLLPLDFIETLQSHNMPDEKFTPSRANTGSVCMHKTSILNPSSTTGSLVAEVRKNKPTTLWLTGTSHPCLSIFIPFFVGTTSRKLIHPSSQPDSSLWWRAERIHQWISKDYQRRKAHINEDRLSLQKQFIDKESALFSGSIPTLPDLQKLSENCLSDVLLWLDKIESKIS